MKMMIHVNRHELRKGSRGKPWTIHTSKGCIPAKEVIVEGPARAQCFPKRKHNPKCFIVVEGTMKRLKKGRYKVTATA
jgi:hypothetical protein